MRSARFTAGLTGAAMLCRCLMWFPLWMLFLCVRDGGIAHFLPCCGILLAASFLTGMLARVIKLRLYASGARVAAAVTLLLLPMLCGTFYLLRLLTGGFWSILLPVAATLIFLASTADAEPDELFSVKVFAAYLSLAAVSSVLLAVTSIPVPVTALLTVTCIEACGFFLLRNQFMLIRLVNRRQAQETGVPAEIRRANLMLACCMALLLPAVLLLREPVAHFLLWLEDGAALLVSVLLHGISRLIAWLGGDPPEPVEIGSGSDGERIPSEGSSSPLWLLVWIPAILIAVYIWREFLSEWVYDIREAIAGLLEKLRSSREPELRAAGETAAYTDTETREMPQQSARRQRRIWKKQLRAWKKLPDGAEKFYAGYRLLLEAPAWRGNLPRDADTVREIRQQWMQMYGTELDRVTDVFQSARYAEEPLSADALTAVSAALEYAGAES